MQKKIAVKPIFQMDNQEADGNFIAQIEKAIADTQGRIEILRNDPADKKFINPRKQATLKRLTHRMKELNKILKLACPAEDSADKITITGVYGWGVDGSLRNKINISQYDTITYQDKDGNNHVLKLGSSIKLMSQNDTKNVMQQIILFYNIPSDNVGSKDLTDSKKESDAKDAIDVDFKDARRKKKFTGDNLKAIALATLNMENPGPEILLIIQQINNECTPTNQQTTNTQKSFDNKVETQKVEIEPEHSPKFDCEEVLKELTKQLKKNMLLPPVSEDQQIQFQYIQDRQNKDKILANDLPFLLNECNRSKPAEQYQFSYESESNEVDFLPEQALTYDKFTKPKSEQLPIKAEFTCEDPESNQFIDATLLQLESFKGKDYKGKIIDSVAIDAVNKEEVQYKITYQGDLLQEEDQPSEIITINLADLDSSQKFVEIQEQQPNNNLNTNLQKNEENIEAADLQEIPSQNNNNQNTNNENTDNNSLFIKIDQNQDREEISTAIQQQEKNDNKSQNLEVKDTQEIPSSNDLKKSQLNESDESQQNNAQKQLDKSQDLTLSNNSKQSQNQVTNELGNSKENLQASGSSVSQKEQPYDQEDNNNSNEFLDNESPQKVLSYQSKQNTNLQQLDKSQESKILTDLGLSQSQYVNIEDQNSTFSNNSKQFQNQVTNELGNSKENLQASGSSASQKEQQDDQNNNSLTSQQQDNKISQINISQNNVSNKIINENDQVILDSPDIATCYKLKTPPTDSLKQNFADFYDELQGISNDQVRSLKLSEDISGIESEQADFKKEIEDQAQKIFVKLKNLHTCDTSEQTSRLDFCRQQLGLMSNNTKKQIRNWTKEQIENQLKENRGYNNKINNFSIQQEALRNQKEEFEQQLAQKKQNFKIEPAKQTAYLYQLQLQNNQDELEEFSKIEALKIEAFSKMLQTVFLDQKQTIEPDSKSFEAYTMDFKKLWQTGMLNSEPDEQFLALEKQLVANFGLELGFSTKDLAKPEIYNLVQNRLNELLDNPDTIAKFVKNPQHQLNLLKKYLYPYKLIKGYQKAPGAKKKFFKDPLMSDDIVKFPLKHNPSLKEQVQLMKNFMRVMDKLGGPITRKQNREIIKPYITAYTKKDNQLIFAEQGSGKTTISGLVAELGAGVINEPELVIHVAPAAIGMDPTWTQVISLQGLQDKLNKGVKDIWVTAQDLNKIYQEIKNSPNDSIWNNNKRKLQKALMIFDEHDHSDYEVNETLNLKEAFANLGVRSQLHMSASLDVAFLNQQIQRSFVRFYGYSQNLNEQNSSQIIRSIEQQQAHLEQQAESADPKTKAVIQKQIAALEILQLMTAKKPINEITDKMIAANLLNQAEQASFKTYLSNAPQKIQKFKKSSGFFKKCLDLIPKVSEQIAKMSYVSETLEQKFNAAFEVANAGDTPNGTCFQMALTALEQDNGNALVELPDLNMQDIEDESGELSWAKVQSNLGLSMLQFPEDCSILYLNSKGQKKAYSINNTNSNRLGVAMYQGTDFESFSQNKRSGLTKVVVLYTKDSRGGDFDDFSDSNIKFQAIAYKKVPDQSTFTHHLTRNRSNDKFQVNIYVSSSMATEIQCELNKHSFKAKVKEKQKNASKKQIKAYFQEKIEKHTRANLQTQLAEFVFDTILTNRHKNLSENFKEPLKEAIKKQVPRLVSQQTDLDFEQLMPSLTQKLLDDKGWLEELSRVQQNKIQGQNQLSLRNHSLNKTVTTANKLGNSNSEIEVHSFIDYTPDNKLIWFGLPTAKSHDDDLVFYQQNEKIRELIQALRKYDSYYAYQSSNKGQVGQKWVDSINSLAKEAYNQYQNFLQENIRNSEAQKIINDVEYINSLATQQLTFPKADDYKFEQLAYYQQKQEEV